MVKDYIFILTSGSSGGVTGTLLTANIPRYKHMRVLALSEERYKPAEIWAIAIMHDRGLCEALFTMKHYGQFTAVSAGDIILSSLFQLMQTIMIKFSGSRTKAMKVGAGC